MQRDKSVEDAGGTWAIKRDVNAAFAGKRKKSGAGHRSGERGPGIIRGQTATYLEYKQLKALVGLKYTNNPWKNVE